MSFYVHREQGDREGWVGPIRSQHQAAREVQAWQDCGWKAVAVPSSPMVKKAVRDWQNKVRAARAAS